MNQIVSDTRAALREYVLSYARMENPMWRWLEGARRFNEAQLMRWGDDGGR